jgi:aspartate/methionine/tyrosine aminotransferase
MNPTSSSPQISSGHRVADSPYIEWAKLKASAKFNLATSGVLGYPLAELPVRFDELEINGPGGRYGYGPLIERLAKHCGAPEECVVTAIGTSLANFLVYAALIETGDDILVEHPAYGPVFEAAQFLGANVRTFSRRFENGFAIEPEAVRRAMTPRTKLIAITNLHNPSGAFTADATLREIGEIAQRAKAHVVVDEVYLDMLAMTSEANRPDVPVRSSFHLGDNFIITSSLTKVYGLSGLRCGWIVAPKDLARKMWRVGDLFENIPAHIPEQLSVIALDNLPKIAARSRTLLTANRALLDRFLDSRDDLETIRPPAGTVVFPRVKQGKAEQFIRLLREKYETSVVPGHFFQMPEHFRIGIGGSTDLLQTGLDRICSALEKVKTS